MKLLDLFSGIGGFSLAAQWAGIDTVAFCEKDKFCQKVLAKHWPNVPMYDDIKSFHWAEKTDILTAGFPCQPFSVAGKKQGKDDDRYLWPELIRVIRECKPNWIILENVPGIIPMLDPILEDLEGEGYEWQAFLIPASAISAPHKRERLWIIAHSNSERLHIGRDNREERHIQADWEQYVKTLQSEWTQFQPESWTTFNAQEWLGFTTDSSSLDSNERTEDLQADTERSERTDIAAEIGDVISDTNSDSEPQANQAVKSTETSRSGHSRTTGDYRSIFNWQKDKPPIPGVDDGLLNGLDRNKALGNSIVPQIPYLFFMMIKYIESEKNCTTHAPAPDVSNPA